LSRLLPIREYPTYRWWMGRNRKQQRGGAKSSPEAEELRAALTAAIEARKELGPEYEQELVESFVERVDRQMAGHNRRRIADLREEAAAARDRARESMGMALGSLGIGIPLTGIASGNGGVWGLVVCWGGILGVNVAHAWARRTNC
jgi:hypothetical protein